MCYYLFIFKTKESEQNVEKPVRNLYQTNKAGPCKQTKCPTCKKTLTPEIFWKIVRNVFYLELPNEAILSASVILRLLPDLV